MEQFAVNNFAVQAAYTTQSYDLLKEIFEIQMTKNPTDPQVRTSLAVAHHESGDTKRAIEILEKAGEDIPSFKEQADGFIEDLLAGRLPGEPEVSVGGEPVNAPVQ